LSTRLEKYREQYNELQSEMRQELKDSGEVFHPNLFVELIPEGLKIWSEQGDKVELPDNALKPLKTVLTYR